MLNSTKRMNHDFEMWGQVFYYINIRKSPDRIGNSSHAENDSVITDKIIEDYENHPSICKISNFQRIKSKFLKLY